jgi:hypothetical protein
MGRPKQRKPPKETRTERLNKDLERAQDKLRELLDDSDDSIAAVRARALQDQRVWYLQSLVLQEKGLIEDATRAARASTQAGELAARLERDTVADRVAALERSVKETRKAGSRLRKLAAKI